MVGRTASEGRKEPGVSVLIAAYRSPAVIEGCLEALRGQNTDSFEVIVVDSSPDQATAAVVDRFDGVRLHRSPERLEPHSARNVGASLARGGLLVFTDADCRPSPSWISDLRAAHASGHELVSGPVECDGDRWWELGVHWCKFGPWTAIGPSKPTAIRPTANLSVSRGAWESIGEFRVTGWSGDSEWCWRAQRAGYEIGFEPGAVVSHHQTIGLVGFLRERWRRGRAFASVRADYWDWGRLRVGLGLAAVPAVPVLLAARRLTVARRAGRLREFWATMPVQLLGYGAWALGEASTWIGRLGGRG